MFRSPATASATARHSVSSVARTPLSSTPQRRGDVPADAADDAQGVGLPVAADLLGDPHDGLADPEGLHEERVEAQDMAGEADPEEMAVESLDLQHDGPDAAGARRNRQGGRLFHGLRVRHVVHAPADAADPLRGHRDLVIGEDRVPELLDGSMDHEAAVFAAAHHLAIDVEAEVGRLIQGRVEGAEGHHHAAVGRVVEVEGPVLVVVGRDGVPGIIAAQRMNAVRPAVRQDQALGVGVAHRLDPHQVAELALGPVGGRHDVGDAVHARRTAGQVGHDTAEHLLPVEGEVVRHQELAGDGAIVQADADDVPRVQVAEDIPAHLPKGLRLYVQEQPAVLRHVRPLDDRREALRDPFQHDVCRHG